MVGQHARATRTESPRGDGLGGRGDGRGDGLWLGVRAPGRGDRRHRPHPYPGGRVDPRAYAPLARAIAQHGFTVVIVRMPLSLAFLDTGAAARVRTETPSITTWAIGGHSLGGVAASSYVAGHPAQMSGLVLLSSYPAEGTDLSAAQGPRGPLQAISIRGSEDGLTTAVKVEASKPRLPPTTVYLVIPGGNHAQMGDYGPQSGDGTAAIPAARQTQQTADAVSLFLGKL
jgi:hypothetical protein